MIVNCPSCAAVVPADDINIRRMVAKCAACNEVFPIDPSIQRTPHQRATVPRPASITLRTGTGEVLEGGYRDPASDAKRPVTIVLTRRWFSPVALFMIVFAIFWDGFLVFWYQTALSTPDPDAMMLVFPLLHVCAGLFITYTALTGLFNRTDITVGEGRMRVAHGPLPWPGRLDLDTGKLRQLFVRRRVSQGRDGQRSYYALAADMNGEILDVLRSLPSVDEARFIEQTIESHLEIVDDPSANEV